MLIHASCVAIDGKGILLTGPPGAGKSDLALRLIDGGGILVADDQCLLRCEGDVLLASPPAAIAGMIEIRHIGLVKMPFVASASVRLYIELTPVEENLERMPERDTVFLLDQRVQRLRLPAFFASTPAKIRSMLAYQMIS